MDILEDFILSLSKEEIRFFKLYANRTNSEKERKDILLFDFIRKYGKKWSEDKIFAKLYPKQSDKNAFYRLKNRLLDDLAKSIFLQHIDSNIELQSFFQFILGKWFIKLGNKKLAIYFLKKAEKKAIDLELFELLDIIYGEFIRLSHDDLNLDVLQYIQLRKENQNVILGIRQLEEILALFSYKMNKSQGYAILNNEIEKINEVLSQLKHESVLLKSSKIQLKLFHAVSRALLQQQNFSQLEVVLKESWNRFLQNQLFSKLPEETPLEMLTFLVNTLFKNQKYQESLQFATILKQYLDSSSASLKSKYLFFYYNSLVINYSVLDKKKALEILYDLEKRLEIQSIAFYGNFIYLNQALLHYQLNQIRDAVKRISVLKQHVGFQSTDPSLKCKISIIELLFRFELMDFDFLEYRIPQFLREFEEQFKLTEFNREKELISILKLMIVSGSTKTLKVQKKIRAFLDQPPSSHEVISYKEWIQKYVES